MAPPETPSPKDRVPVTPPPLASSEWSSGTWQLAWWGWLAIILCATTIYSNVFVGHSHWMLVKWIPFQRYGSWGEYWLDLVQNMLLFLPLGYLQAPAGLAGSAHRLVIITLTGLFLSTGIELFQVYSHNRSPGTTDIIINGTGAFLGAYWYQRTVRTASKTLSIPRPHSPVPSRTE